MAKMRKSDTEISMSGRTANSGTAGMKGKRTCYQSPTLLQDSSGSI